ncbi:MAG: sulfatase-like hydrolase/transferase [Planctomycetota bacterium]|nr:sulfatase-like hydrolase/transferase [Planctomycetota bacterium]MDA1211780.1 sulfatase-like hydrolase/transferase [Planctomycetota bacterium]
MKPCSSRGRVHRIHCNVRIILFVALMFVWCVVANKPVCADEISNRPNIVIILCDDLGYGDLGCYGNPEIKTPHLDDLAKQGLLCTSFYAASPVCSPSRAGLLTGKTPNRLGIVDWIPEGSPMHLHKGERTVGSMLSSVDYDTCHVGKWHCNGHFNSPEQPQPDEHGFKHWFSTQNNSLPTHLNPLNFVRNGTAVGPREGYSSTIIVDEAIDWLKGRRARTSATSTTPFLLCVWFHSPHEVIATSPEFTKRYAKVMPEKKAEYYGNVTQMDHEVGRLLQELDIQQLRDSSFVLFTSDNGPETLNRYGPNSSRSYGTAKPLRGMKLHMYEGGIRVPGIFRWPGKINAGTETDVPLCTLDLLASCCHLAGIDASAVPVNDGTDIVAALLEDETFHREQPLYWQYDRAIGTPKVAVREGAWKLLADAELNQFELYNLVEDPSEANDVSVDEPDCVLRLANFLRERHAAVLKDLNAVNEQP